MAASPVSHSAGSASGVTAATASSAAAPRALAGLKVIDLTHYVAGPYATKLMAGFGAEVIKIERPPAGDPMRQAGPFVDGAARGDGAAGERSIPFLWLNTGKQSVTLNFKSPEGVALLRRLVDEADVLVENFSPRVMPSLGLDYESLRKTNPRLVMASISNFGQSGPYRDWRADEIELYAMGGAMHLTGEPQREPLGPGVAVSQYTAAVSAYTAVLMALWERQRDGEGQAIDVPILQNVLDLIETNLADHLERGVVGRRGPHTFTPWGLFACRDGYVSVIGAPFRHWPRCAEMFEDPRLLDDDLRIARHRSQRRDEITALMKPWLERHDRHDIFARAIDRDLAFGYLASLEEVVHSPQHRAREFFVEVDHPVAGRLPYSGAPFRMSATPWQNLRAPLLGEHNESILGERLGCSAAELAQWRQQGVI